MLARAWAAGAGPTGPVITIDPDELRDYLGPFVEPARSETFAFSRGWMREQFEMLHWSFEDPSQAEGSEDERLAVFRRVRDEIRVRIERELVKSRSSPELPRIPLPRRWVNKARKKRARTQRPSP